MVAARKAARNSDPEALFQMIPGVGPALARSIHEHIDCSTLEALEAAAHDGRLAAVPESDGAAARPS